MGNLLLDDCGEPIHIHGYAGVFNVPRADGHPEIVMTGAFDAILKHPPASLNCQFHHGGLKYIAGSIALDTLRIWADDFGLAFEAGPFYACGRNWALLDCIASGEVRGASWSGLPGHPRDEIINGDRLKVFRRFKSLDHIAPVADPAYPETGIWLSSEHPDDLPRRLKLLSEFWATHRPRYDAPAALRKMSRAVSRLPRRAPAPKAATSRPQARPVARRRVPAPLAMSEIYFDGCGFSGAELANLALQERKAWRMLKAKHPGISLARARRAT